MSFSSNNHHCSWILMLFRPFFNELCILFRFLLLLFLCFYLNSCSFTIKQFSVLSWSWLRSSSLLILSNFMRIKNCIISFPHSVLGRSYKVFLFFVWWFKNCKSFSESLKRVCILFPYRLFFWFFKPFSAFKCPSFLLKRNFIFFSMVHFIGYVLHISIAWVTHMNELVHEIWVLNLIYISRVV